MQGLQRMMFIKMSYIKQINEPLSCDQLYVIQENFLYTIYGLLTENLLNIHQVMHLNNYITPKIGIKIYNLDPIYYKHVYCKRIETF